MRNLFKLLLSGFLLCFGGAFMICCIVFVFSGTKELSEFWINLIPGNLFIVEMFLFVFSWFAIIMIGFAVLTACFSFATLLDKRIENE